MDINTNTKKLLMGNEALALALAKQGCRVALAYPGTPSSEILPSFKKWCDYFGKEAYVHWAINEKVAFETAYTASMAGLRAMTAMKQVGLNVASDALMSSAYMGVRGGFILISADDPGPHSSQTEQDSRMMAMIAKIPVLDPYTPASVLKIVEQAYRISEQFQIPVMIRPTTRLCHGTQDVDFDDCHDHFSNDSIGFTKEPARWAATPKFRLQQHIMLNEKIQEIAKLSETEPKMIKEGLSDGLAVVSSGVVSSHMLDLIAEQREFEELTLYQVLQPYPLHRGLVEQLIKRHRSILVVEETYPVIEMQIARSDKVRGRSDGLIPNAGELLPETIEVILREFCGIGKKTFSVPTSPITRRPSLCPGCPHRATFFGIKKVFKPSKSIYTSDIGCYTLGINFKAVDTFICMGGAISQATGFYKAFKLSDKEKPQIVATIGDSTFFHSGIPPLIDAVAQSAKFVLVILDNSTTAMTGGQPTPAQATDEGGAPLISIEKVVKGCGVKFCKTVDPYDFNDLTKVLKSAQKACQRGVAVVIAKAPCLMDKINKKKRAIAVKINERCDGCGYCVNEFECPALVGDKKQKQTYIDYGLCNHCGVCLQVCPKGAIEPDDKQ